MDFYHNLITEKSWSVLLELRHEYNFVLIGGWAVFLYTHGLKSKDIDVVLEYETLEKLRSKLSFYKNERLKKYEVKKEEIDIDIYVPFYSNPGLPAEELVNLRTSVEGFDSVEKEILAILKQKALMERKDSVKGRKDLIDLISLFQLDEFDWERYLNAIKRYGLKESLESVRKTVIETTKIDELDLNIHKFARFKRRVLPLLSL